MAQRSKEVGRKKKKPSGASSAAKPRRSAAAIRKARARLAERVRAARRAGARIGSRGPKTVNCQVTLSTDTSILLVCDPMRLRHRSRDKKGWWADEKALHQEAVRGHMIPIHTGADGIFNLRVTTGRLTAHETEFREEERSGFWIEVRSGKLFLGTGEDLPGDGHGFNEDAERQARLRSGRYSAIVYKIEEVDDDLPTYVVRLTPIAAADRPPEPAPPAAAVAEGDQETDFEKAEKLLEAGEIEVAERICSSYLAGDTDEHSYDFRTLRAKARRLRGDLDGAYQDITAAIDDFAFGERIAEFARVLYARGEKERGMDVALWAILDSFNEYPLVLEVRAMRMGWLIAEKRLTEAQVHLGAIREDRTIMSPRSEPKLFEEIDKLRTKIKVTEKPRFANGAPTIETPEEDIVGTVRHKLEINADKPWKQLELLMIGCRLGPPRSEFKKQRDDLATRLIKIRKS